MKYSCYLILPFLLFACKPEIGYKVCSGEEQGTTYLIKYESITGEEFDDEIDSIFLSVDQNFSTYAYSSKLSTGLSMILGNRGRSYAQMMFTLPGPTIYSETDFPFNSEVPKLEACEDMVSRPI